MSRLLRASIAVALLGAGALTVPANAGQPTHAGPPPAMSCQTDRQQPRLRTCTVALPDGVSVASSTVQVVVPAGYDAGDVEYPVVFMLHGVGDSYSSWARSDRGDLVARTASCEAIFVMPDGGSGTVAGWYSDWVDGRYQYETFHTSVLPRAIDGAFRTQGRKHRAVAGLSMGGFGALSYTARHPGLFRAAASYSGFVDTMFGAPVTGAFFEVGGQNPAYTLGTPSKGVWGDQTTDAETWRAHNPYDLAAALRGTPLYLSAGHGAPNGEHGNAPDKAHGNATEAYIGLVNDRLMTRLGELGIPYTDGSELGGQHDWPYWRANFTRSLGVLMPALGAATTGCGA